MRRMNEQEDKYEVDSDWVIPQITDLVPDGGRLDQQVRELDSTYFDTPSAGLRVLASRCAAGSGAPKPAGS